MPARMAYWHGRMHPNEMSKIVTQGNPIIFCSPKQSLKEKWHHTSMTKLLCSDKINRDMQDQFSYLDEMMTSPIKFFSSQREAFKLIDS
jgi:hypothetical protein